MKKRSRILLLSGGIIMAAGLIICIIGAIVSYARGDQLFAAKTDGGRSYVYYFSGDEINKVDISVADANVNIIGGAEKSYIELVNFNENLYSFSASNRLISFKQSPDLSSVLRFWESGFTFKGMRYLLRFQPAKGQRSVNIYLSDKDYVKNFTVSARSGKFSVSTISTSTDYNFSLTDGEVKMTDVKTGSLITINAVSSSDCDIIFQNVSASTLTVKAAQADLTAAQLAVKSADIDISHGSAAIEYLPTAEYYRVAVAAGGKITANDKVYIDTFDFSVTPPDIQEEPESTGTAETALVTVDGRDLSVYLTGDCFNNPAGKINVKEQKETKK